MMQFELELFAKQRDSEAGEWAELIMLIRVN